MAKLTKILRRQLSADERLHRFFKQREHELLERFRLARVEMETSQGVLLLQVLHVGEDGNGVVVRVR